MSDSNDPSGTDRAEPDQPHVLGYAQPTPQRGGFASLVLFLAGFGGSVLGTSALGCGVFDVLGYPLEGKRDHISPLPPVLFAVLLAGAVAAGALHRRIQRQSLRWLTLGLLLGTGIMSLVEGICFVSR